MSKESVKSTQTNKHPSKSKMSVTTESNFESVMEAVLELDVGDQWKVVETLLKSLKKSAKTTKRAKKEKDPDAPKKEPSEWAKFTSHVAEILKPLAEAEKKRREEAGEAKLPAGVHFKVSGLLKEKGLVGSATSEQIQEAFEEFLANPDAMSETQKKRQAKKEGSVGDSDEAKKAAKEAKKAEKAEKEAAKEAKKAEKAEKKESAKQTKDSKKPAKKPEPEAEEAESEAEEEAAEAAAGSAAEAEDDAVEGVLKTYKINGKEGKYSCYANEDEPNTEYLCDAVTGKFVGLYNTKTKVLKTDVEDPFA